MSKLTENEINDFNRDGYLLKPRLFGAEGMQLLNQVAESDQRLERGAFAA